MKKLVCMAAIAMVLTVFNGCTKEELKTSPDEVIAKTGKADVYLENGYLAFKNMNAVDSVTNVLSKMSRQEKDAWEQKIGLKSARAEYDKLFDEYEKLTSYEEFQKFKSKYADQLKFNEMDETDCSIDYPFASTFFRPVLNNKGVFKVGLSLFKFTKENQIIVLDGDMKKLENLRDYSNDKNVIQNTNLKVARSNNGFIMMDQFIDECPFLPKQAYWTTGDRRVLNQLTIDMWVYWEDTDPFLIVSKGYKFCLKQNAQKKSWLVGWRNYATIYEFKNVNYKIDNNSYQTVSYANGGVSPEVSAGVNWIIVSHEESWPHSGIWSYEYWKPIFNFNANISCRGLDGILYPITHIE
jgi:hypothetical protein